ncbi:MAG: hypothetical protein SA339_12275 [Methanomassiliicoccus sp.]|nr:hypothetical protein [Methanomassiliicoccus sp.]
MTRDVATPPEYAPTTVHSSWPYVLAMIGGILVLVEGVIIAVAGPLIMIIGGTFGLGALLYGIFVAILGLIMMGLAVGLSRTPNSHVGYGAGIIIISVIALVLAGGGFVIGSILGIIGGAWAIMRP